MPIDQKKEDEVHWQLIIIVTAFAFPEIKGIKPPRLKIGQYRGTRIVCSRAAIFPILQRH